MFLEGEINWTLTFALLAAFSGGVTLVSLWYAVSNGVRHASASDQLDLVQRVAEASDRRLFETLDAVPVALVEADHAGKFVFANRAANQLLGRRDAELLGLRFHSATWGITFPDGKPIPTDLLPGARALRGQTVRGFQHLMVNAATRKKMIVSVTAMPIKNESGHVSGSISAIVETEGLITPVIEPAEPAGPSVADRVFEAAFSALVIVDRDGRVLRINRTAQEMLGYDDDVAGADFADLFMPAERRMEGRQTLHAALSAALAAPDEDREPVITPGVDGRTVEWALLPLELIEDEQEMILLAGAAVAPTANTTPVEALADSSAADASSNPADAQKAENPETELNQARADFALRETELVASRDQALAEAARIEREARAELDTARRMEGVGRLTGGVAHDFNALLGVMTAALDMILRQADEPERVKRLGEAALTAGRRGEALTRRLAAFSQGEDPSIVQVLDLGVLLRGLESRLRETLDEGIDLMVEAPTTPAGARVDPVAFEGAILALVRNAAQASNKPGSIAVRLESLDDGLLRLSIRDAGEGMSSDILRRAQEPFFTTRSGAAGLGLAQAYAFARQSGGDLSIESAPGEGTEVSIILPSARG